MPWSVSGWHRAACCGGCSAQPWRSLRPRSISVDIVDERGRRLERRPVATREAAEVLTAALNA
ncbi:MAG: hypothetical protein IPO93_18220 [Actinobacteria bacterium]|nr:hypothetical protein [Actinomycetota bacterium]